MCHFSYHRSSDLFSPTELVEFAELSENDARLHLGNLLPSLDSGLDAEGKPGGCPRLPSFALHLSPAELRVHALTMTCQHCPSGEATGNAGDGAVDHGELSIRLVRVELDRMGHDAANHVDDADEDGDGLLSWKELTHVRCFALVQTSFNVTPFQRTTYSVHLLVASSFPVPPWSQLVPELGITPMLAVKRFARADQVGRLHLPTQPPWPAIRSDSHPRAPTPASQNQDKFLTENEVLAFFHPDIEPRMFSTLAEEVIAMLDEVRPPTPPASPGRHPTSAHTYTVRARVLHLISRAS